MAHREPTPRSRSARKAITWALAVSNLLIFGVFVFLLADAGILQTDWGWIVAFAGALAFLGDFYLLRYLINRSARMKQAGEDL